MNTADRLEREALARQQIAAGRTYSLPGGDMRSAITGTGAGSRGQSQLPRTQYEQDRMMEALRNVPPSFWSGGRTGGNQTGGGGSQPSEPPPSFTPPREPAAPAAGTESNVNMLDQWFQDAKKYLSDLAARGGQTIGESVGRMKADPYNMANVYANLALAAPTVAANPIAEYAAAAGLSPAQAEAATQLAAAESAATGRALQNISDVMRTAQEQANLSRMSDIGLIETGAQQDLQDRLATMALALEQSRIGGLTNLQQQNLQNEMNARNNVANLVSSVFSGQNVAPESILKLIQETLNRMNTNRWATLPNPGREMGINPPVPLPTGPNERGI
jgi:hypothetical protein